jgi:phage terminase small subunit
VKLTEKQKRFADYYIETGNATESYKRAGYSVNSDEAARVNASRLLTNANVRAYIDERIAEKDSQRIAKQDEILEFLTKVMRGELTEQIPVGLGEGYFELKDKDTYIKDRVKAAEAPRSPSSAPHIRLRQSCPKCAATRTFGGKQGKMLVVWLVTRRPAALPPFACDRSRFKDWIAAEAPAEISGA